MTDGVATLVECEPLPPPVSPPRRRQRAHVVLLRETAARQAEYAAWAVRVADHVVAALVGAAEQRGEAMPVGLERAAFLFARIRSDLEAAVGGLTATTPFENVRAEIASEHVEALVAAHRIATAHEEELIGRPEAAVILGCGVTKVCDLGRRGRLLAIPRGHEWRYLRAEVEALAEQLRSTEPPGVRLTDATRHLGLPPGKLRSMVRAGELVAVARRPLRLDPGDVAELEAQLRQERLSALDVAEAAGIPLWEVTRSINSGDLPCTSTRRRHLIPRAAADVYVEQWRTIWRDYMYGVEAAKQIGMSRTRFMRLVRGGRIRHLNGGHGLRNRCFVLRADVEALGREIAERRADSVHTGELAQMMGVSPAYIDKKIRSGELRPSRDRRTGWAIFPRSVAEALAADHRARIGDHLSTVQTAIRLRITEKRLRALVSAGYLEPKLWRGAWRFDPGQVARFAVMLQREGRTRPAGKAWFEMTVAGLEEKAKQRGYQPLRRGRGAAKAAESGEAAAEDDSVRCAGAGDGPTETAPDVAAAKRRSRGSAARRG